MSSKLLIGIGVVLLALVGYLLFAPIPAQPQAWHAPQQTGYVGSFERNNRLQTLVRTPLDHDQGPEHLVAHDGWLYMGLLSGHVARLPINAAPNTPLQVLFDTGGRPLGLAFDTTGRLIIADAIKGLLRVTLATPETPVKIETLVSQVDDEINGQLISNDPIRFANSVVVAKNGLIYFSDSSRHFAPAQFGGTLEASTLDLIEHSCTGRLLAYDPQTRYIRVVLRQLCFPNGLALAQDEQSIFLSETGLYRILQISINLHGLDAAQALSLPNQVAKVVLDNLPGFPDNLVRGENGRIWGGLVSPRSELMDLAAPYPKLRAMLLRLPQRLWPKPTAYGHVFAIDENGKVLVDLQDPAGQYPSTTSATEVKGRLFIQSLESRSLGWLDKQ